MYYGARCDDSDAKLLLIGMNAKSLSRESVWRLSVSRCHHLFITFKRKMRCVDAATMEQLNGAEGGVLQDPSSYVKKKLLLKSCAWRTAICMSRMCR